MALSDGLNDQKFRYKIPFPFLLHKKLYINYQTSVSSLLKAKILVKPIYYELF